MALTLGAGANDFLLLPAAFSVDGKQPIALQGTVASSYPLPEIVVPADRIERLEAHGPGQPQLRVVAVGNEGLRLEINGVQPGMLLATAAIRPHDVDDADERIPMILGEYRIAPAAAAAVAALPRPRNRQMGIAAPRRGLVVRGRLPRSVGCGAVPPECLWSSSRSAVLTGSSCCSPMSRLYPTTRQ